MSDQTSLSQSVAEEKAVESAEEVKNTEKTVTETIVEVVGSKPVIDLSKKEEIKPDAEDQAKEKKEEGNQSEKPHSRKGRKRGTPNRTKAQKIKELEDSKKYWEKYRAKHEKDKNDEEKRIREIGSNKSESSILTNKELSQNLKFGCNI